MNKHALISIITSCCLCMSVSPISPKNIHTLSHPDQTITNHQIKFACKWIIRLWDIVDSVVFWLYKPCDIDLEDSNPFFFLQPFSLWWCITISSLVTNDTAVQNMWSGSLNVQGDLDCEHSNPIFPLDTLALRIRLWCSAFFSHSLSRKVSRKLKILNRMWCYCCF